MTLEALVGQRLVVGVPGTEPSEAVLAHLRRIHAGGIIAFERNFTSPEQFSRLVRGLEEALQRPLLVMVDHEGGRVIRFRKGLTQFPAAQEQAVRAGPAGIERQGEVEAEELRRIGVHVNLAPCVDVLVEGSDPVIGDRSYGGDPERVSACALARIRGLQSHGVAACAKHFPGLGGVPRDPHQTLSTVALDRATMNTVHLRPFRASLAAGVGTIMSSHVCYPQLGDPDGLPATWSSRLIRDLLRTELGFEGLILTDDLEMGALHARGTIGEGAVRAVEAGHDLVLVCRRPEAQGEVFNALCAASRSKRLDEEDLQTCMQRVATLRAGCSAGRLAC